MKNQKSKIKNQNRVLQPEIKPTADDFVHSAPRPAPLTTVVSAGGVHEIVRTRRRPPPRPSQPHSLGAGNNTSERESSSRCRVRALSLLALAPEAVTPDVERAC